RRTAGPLEAVAVPLRRGPGPLAAVAVGALRPRAGDAPVVDDGPVAEFPARPEPDARRAGPGAGAWRAGVGLSRRRPRPERDAAVSRPGGAGRVGREPGHGNQVHRSGGPGGDPGPRSRPRQAAPWAGRRGRGPALLRRLRGPDRRVLRTIA